MNFEVHGVVGGVVVLPSMSQLVQQHHHGDLLQWSDIKQMSYPVAS
jgi:hypothetical protein